MTTYEMNDFGFDMEPMMKHREHWVEQGRHWRDLDRVVMSEEQMITLAERLMDTDYFSSQTLLCPSIPEFTALIEEDGREENTYVCFRRSVMAETDFLEPTHEGLTRIITPAVDAYVYINNKGRMCNLVATIARVELEYEGRKMTSTAQFLTWYHDDPATLYVVGHDRAYFQEFLRSIKFIYLGVQMLSLERPEALTAETVREEYSGTVKKKGRYKPVRKARFVKMIRVTSVAAPRGSHNITCPVGASPATGATTKAESACGSSPTAKAGSAGTPPPTNRKSMSFRRRMSNVQYFLRRLHGTGGQLPVPAPRGDHG